MFSRRSTCVLTLVATTALFVVVVSSKVHSDARLTTCTKTPVQIRAEKKASNNFKESYRACYNIHFKNRKCQLQDFENEPLEGSDKGIEISEGIFADGLFHITTPNKGGSGSDVGDYPDNKFCTYVLKKRRAKHQYSYIFNPFSPFDIEEDENTNERCNDCLEHHHTRNGQVTTIMTCGSSVDSRLDGGKGPLSDVKLVFKSDGSKGGTGADFHIAEFSPNSMSVKGPPGYKGSRGFTGSRGQTGPDGDTGLPGQRGEIGNEGPDGIQGNKGSKGIKGTMGTPGWKGKTGPKGIPGPPGLPGTPCKCTGSSSPSLYCVSVNGEPGDPGEAGWVGVTGQPGFRGARGAPGTNGKNGLQGPPGDPGRSDYQGDPGDRGPPGLTGLPGPKGKPGLSHCPGLSKRDIENLRVVVNTLSSNVPMHKSYFDAWRGHKYPLNPNEIILRHYLEEDDEINRTNVYNYNNTLFDKSQFHIRRGTVLTAWAISKAEILAKLEEQEKYLESDDQISRRAESTRKGFPTTSSLCPKGQQGLRGALGPTGPPGDKGERGKTGFPGAKGPRGYPGDNGSKGTRGNIGYQGQPGATGPPGIAGKQGQPGRKGLLCEEKKIGAPGLRGKRVAAIGPLGEKGFKGDNGYPGIHGVRGYTGLPGDPGISGYDGASGDKGEKGKDGKIGPKGLQGLRGPPGIPGPPGPPGHFPCVCKLFKIMLDEYYIIKPSGGLIHQIIINTDTNQFMPGPPGPVANSYCVPGPPGIPGDGGQWGPKGYSGELGTPGGTGRGGAIGPNGKKGSKGFRGETGETGLVGRSGAVGDDGPPGSAGSDGPPGQKCNANGRDTRATDYRCPTGRKGEKGRRGARGLQGYPGPQGSKGLRGVPGIPGKSGPKGYKGLAGHPGRRGPTGEIGVQGPPGPPGLPGTPGNRDLCPEFDGIDLSLLQANPKEYEAIQRLVYRREKGYACTLTDASQPLLQQLAFDICYN